ncbi:MAG: hypothetical protein U9R42_06935, partial [Bacteroidota bacterium]|nr:hypothetical protein [Bacteroidota bacterium]
RESAKSSVFQYTLACGVEYLLNNSIAFSLMANYSSGRNKFEYMQALEKDVQQNSVINFSGGVVYYFF